MTTFQEMLISNFLSSNETVSLNFDGIKMQIHSAGNHRDAKIKIIDGATYNTSSSNDFVEHIYKIFQYYGITPDLEQFFGDFAE